MLAAEIDDQLPLNYGLNEYEWIAQEAKQHPIFQLESTFTNLEGLPNELVEKVRQLADIVDAERELFYELRRRESAETDVFVDEFTMESHSTEQQLWDALDRLETKELIRIDDGRIIFETDPL